MNDQERLELEQLKRRQELLQHQVALLTRHITEFGDRLSAELPTTPPPIVISPLTPPPKVSPKPSTVRAEPQEVPPIIPTVQPTVEPPVEPASVVESPIEPKPQVEEPPIVTTPPAPAPVETREFTAPPPNPPVARPEPKEKSSFELRLGTFWLVRIGIVVLLTGLAFLGYYAYDNIIGRLGAAGKLSLIYFAGALLFGAGAWLQRKIEKPAMKNYGQVLFAGGLATIYFATYAAHYLPQLRVISSGFIDGLLLLAWAAVIVWIADRRKSEVLALFAICLAYYTAVVTDIGLFTLYSNVVLTSAAVFFLLRNRWATLSIVSLPATYAAFLFWRFYHHDDFLWDLRAHELTYANIFLAGYWVLFTAAAFLSRSDKLTGATRAAYLTTNNAAFFGMVLLSMLHYNHGGFWKFCIGFGIVLIALSQAAREWLADEPLCARAYLTQGIILVTVGIIAYFSGLQLALMLAAESTALLLLSYQQSSKIMRAGAILASALAVPYLIVGMEQHPSTALAFGVAASFGFNLIWASRHEVAGPRIARRLTTYFSLLAMIVWAYLDYKFVPTQWFGTSLAIGSLLLMGGFYALKITEGVCLAQTYLVISQILWLTQIANSIRPAWWHPLIVIVATVAASHFWQWQKRVAIHSAERHTLQGIYAFATVGVLYTWMQPQFEPGTWLMLTSLFALGLTIYALATRAWLLALASQLFLVVSGAEFVHQLSLGKPDWYMALVPIIVFVSMVWIVSELFFERLPKELKETVPHISLFYLGIAVAMSLWWVHDYIPECERVWVLGLVGTTIFLATAWKGSKYVAAFGGVYLAVALGRLMFTYLNPSPEIYFPDALFILALLGLQQLIHRKPKQFPIRPQWGTAIIVSGLLALWLFTSRWVVDLSGGTVYLTVAWAGLALITIAGGFAMRQHLYRWIGLGILACALGRVVIDVWQLEIIYRILSLLALGVVLLALGFVYNKYQEKIREWL
jgi:uncharacterized membrane protein